MTDTFILQSSGGAQLVAKATGGLIDGDLWVTAVQQTGVSNKLTETAC